MQVKIGKNKSTVEVIFKDKATKSTPLGFTGKNGEIKLSGNTIIVGTKGIKDSEDWRVLGVKLTKFLKSIKVKSASINVPKKCGEFVEGLVLGDYTFDKYKSKPEKSKLQTIYIKSEDDIKQTVNRAIDAAKATCLTRDLVNETPENCNSITIEKDLKKMFDNTAVKMTVYNDDDLEEMGAQAILHVNRASKYPTKIIKLVYEPETPKKHHIFVMKTLTYDSGGLSIKPDMTAMKSDMSGGAAGIGVMKYLSKHGSNSKVTMYLTIAENMISSDSYRPDDIITEMNGVSIHVKNTDAEGRLALASGLGLAQKENKKFDTLNTVATLTGAAVYILGDEVAGLVGFNEKLKKNIIKAGEKAGEILMSAQFHKYMMDAVDDDIADVSNTGTPGQGMTKAGLFLTKFVDKKQHSKFVHWDIAGPAHCDKAWGHNPAGGTGFGVRTILSLVD